MRVKVWTTVPWLMDFDSGRRVYLPICTRESSETESVPLTNAIEIQINLRNYEIRPRTGVAASEHEIYFWVYRRGDERPENAGLAVAGDGDTGRQYL